MVVLNDTDNLTMWVCEKYGVSMLASHATDICARRFAAANNKGTRDGISFSHCRTCARGRTEYKLAGRKKYDVSVKENKPAAGQAGKPTL
jgi:hypothetical protein